MLEHSESAPVPEIKPDEILVRNSATGVNFIDTYHRTGLYPVTMPFTPGREGAGTVRSVGSAVTRFKAGDRVAYFCAGSYAELTAVPESRAVPLPDGVEESTASAAMLQGLTAHYLVTSTFPVRPCHTVLVHAGAGGTGGLLVQMAKMRGARVIATVSTPEKAEAVRALGADHAVLYRDVAFDEEARRLTGGEGVDAVYDGVGKATWEGSLRALKPRGMCVLFGNASGAVPPVDPLLLTRSGSLFLTRPSLANYVATAEEFEARTRDLFQWIREGKLRVRVARVFPLAEADEAHRFLESRKALGKVVIQI